MLLKAVSETGVEEINEFWALVANITEENFASSH